MSDLQRHSNWYFRTTLSVLLAFAIAVLLAPTPEGMSVEAKRLIVVTIVINIVVVVVVRRDALAPPVPPPLLGVLPLCGNFEVDGRPGRARGVFDPI